MPDKARAFLDTSAVFAGLWSPTGGARLILKLAEAGSLEVWVSPQVLAELDSVIRNKAPGLLGVMGRLFDRVQARVCAQAPQASVENFLALTHHQGDARVIADAVEAQPDFFVTLDTRHFLENTALKAALPFPVGTPGDFLEWLRARFAVSGKRDTDHG